MIGAVITTRNEAATIATLVRNLRSQGLPVIVVDEGSTDDTVALALEAGANVVMGCGGIGPCLMAGWRLGLNQGWTRIAQLDAGGSHDVGDLSRLLACDADLVIGSRFVRGGAHLGNPRRALLSRATAAACNLAQAGARYRDWTSGYRVLSARAARYLLSRRYLATMHGWQIETLAYAGEHGLSIIEAPICYRAGRSSLNRRVAWEAAQVWLHILNHVGWVGSQWHEEAACE